MSARAPTRDAAVSMGSCVCAGLLFALGYAGLFRATAPQYYLFLILGTYLLLGGVALWQVTRAARMGSRRRRLAAVGVVVGLAATIFLGLRPRPACLDAGPCQSGLTVQPARLLVGVALTSVSLFLDVRNPASRLLGEDDP